MILKRTSSPFIVAVVASCAAAIVDPVHAQSKDSTMAPTPVVVGGYVDSYFSFNFARPLSHFNQMRNFDVTENQITVANAELSVTKAASPLGFRVDLDYGPTNDIVQSGAVGSIANVGQAYVTYVAPLGQGLTIDAGKFVTHMGFEVIKAKDDYNYSRSLLFALAIPYYHLGVRATYPFSSTFSLCVHMYNCYNGTVPPNSGKSFGFAATYTPSSDLTLIANYLGGPALPDSISKKFRNEAELIGTYQATSNLSFTVDGVYGQDNLPLGTAIWRSLALYARYQLTDPSALTLRGEVFVDPLAYMTGGTSTELREATLTYEYKLLSSLILRGEYRYDISNVALYDDSTGPAKRTDQSTLTVGAIVVF